MNAEYIHSEFLDKASQYSLAFIALEVDCDRLFTAVRSHEVAVPVITGYRPSDVSVGITLRFSSWYRRWLDSDDAPA